MEYDIVKYFLILRISKLKSNQFTIGVYYGFNIYLNNKSIHKNNLQNLFSLQLHLLYSPNRILLERLLHQP